MEDSTLIQIRTHIRDTIGNELGTYKFKDGSTKPAISILPDKTFGYDYPPQGTVTTGIECVLHYPRISHKRFFDGYMQKSRIDIFLKDFGNGAKLNRTMECLFNALYQFRYFMSDPVYIGGNKQANVIPQAQVSVYVLENVEINYVR